MKRLLWLLLFVCLLSVVAISSAALASETIGGKPAVNTIRSSSVR